MEWVPAVQPPTPRLFVWRLDVLHLVVLVLLDVETFVFAALEHCGNDGATAHPRQHEPRGSWAEWQQHGT